MEDNKALFPGITLEQAKGLHRGQMLGYRYGGHRGTGLDADGKTIARYKVTSVKTWKRSPGRVLIVAHRGYYASGYIRLDENMLEDLCVLR